jgi:hypothetical protein
MTSEPSEGSSNFYLFRMKNKVVFATLLSVVCAPIASLAGTSADINASGSSPGFCDISNTGGAITMSISAEKDKLSGSGTYQFMANGDAKVSLSALTPTAPQGAAAYTPSVSLANLVTNSSITTGADSATQAGTNKVSGAITTEFVQNNSQGLLSAGSYGIVTTATCTAL